MAAFTNTTIIADTADVEGFMGANVSIGFTVTMQDLIGVYAEAFLCNLVKYDIVTNWGTLNAVYKLIFSEYACRIIAIESIKYDMNVYTSRIEAEDLLTIHAERNKEIKKLLEDEAIQAFMQI